VQAVHACGLSVATSTVLNTSIRPTYTIPTIKSVAVGLVLQRVVEAAELAALGVTATEDALETVFSRLSSQPGVRFEPTPVEKLGQRWTMTRNMIKLYPAQVNTQAAIEATLRLSQNGIRARHVKKLSLHGHRNVAGGVQGSAQAFAPVSREGADHSTPYVMAMALLRGRLTPAEFERSPWGILRGEECHGENRAGHRPGNGHGFGHRWNARRAARRGTERWAHRKSHRPPTERSSGCATERLEAARKNELASTACVARGYAAAVA
jgi:hypothetical protein